MHWDWGDRILMGMLHVNFMWCFTVLDFHGMSENMGENFFNSFTNNSLSFMGSDGFIFTSWCSRWCHMLSEVESTVFIVFLTDDWICYWMSSAVGVFRNFLLVHCQDTWGLAFRLFRVKKFCQHTELKCFLFQCNWNEIVNIWNFLNYLE